MIHVAANFQNLLLIIPEKFDSERDAVANTWETQGGEVLRIGRFWEPPTIDRSRVRLYGNDTFCLVLAQQLELELVSPSDDFLLRVDHHWLKRSIEVYPLSKASQLAYPKFIKPVIPKQFRAKVYNSSEELLDECRGLEDDTLVLVSEVVKFLAEARAFVLDGQVEACGVYEGEAETKDIITFVSAFTQANHLPKTCVIDVGYQATEGWSVLETNATWGAGLNGCEPLGAAKCIAHATLMCNE